MYHQFMEFADIDITKGPMEVFPTTHYVMGGVKVEGDTCSSTVPGLFAAGEVAGGMHGANRLGGNSLSDLLVFGKRAGEGAAAYASGKSHAQIPAELVEVGEREKIVQIPNASSAPKLADKFSYAFRMTENEGLQFQRVISTLKNRGMPIGSAAIMYGTDDVVSKAVGLFIMKPIFEKNGVKLAKAPIGFETKAVDVSAQVTQLKGQKIDYVGLAGITPVAVRVLKEMRRQGVMTPIIGAQIWADPEITRQMAKDGEGAVFSAWFWYKKDERSREFTRKFVEGNKKRGIDKPFPHHVDASAYDAVYLLKQVMEEQKVTGDPDKVAEERTRIRDGLNTVVFNGVIGQICFEKTGDAQLPGYVMTMKNSEWVLLGEHKSLPCKK